MQYPNNAVNANNSFLLPKASNPFNSFASLGHLFQAFSTMNSFYNFPFPPTQDLLQAKLYQAMLEKLMPMPNNQIPKSSNPLLQTNPLLNPTQENPFMSVFYDTYLKLLKNQISKSPNNLNPTNSSLESKGNTSEISSEAKALFAIKEEFIQEKTDIKDIKINPLPTQSPPINANITPHVQNNIEEEAKKNDLNPETCIKDMLFYFVKHVGTIRRNVLEKEGEKIHHNNEELKEVFLGLLKKFLSSRKTKEEKIKYVLRKCFKFMKDKLLEENGFSFDSSDDYVEKLNSDKVDKMFFKHYFSEKCGKQKKFLTKNEITFIKDISMPFRKNSQNKTMNIEFLKWIFSNEQFYLDYKQFLKNFNEVTSQDNVEKISKTAKKIFELMETKNYKGFSQKYFKRMPWLDIWRIEAKEIALNLMDIYSNSDEKQDILDTEEISLETLEPKAKKVKPNEENNLEEKTKI